MKISRFKGEAAIIFASFFYSTESILVKKVSSQLTGYQISFFRFTFGLIFSILFILILKKSFKVKNWKLVSGRAVAGVISMISFYMAVSLGNPGRAILLNLTFPIFATLYGFLFFKERARWQDFLGITLCISGVILVFYDNTQVPLLANVFGLVSGAAAGFAVHFIRKASQDHNSFLLYLVVCVLGAIVSGFSLPGIRDLNMNILLLLTLISTIVFTGQIIMQSGYRYTTAVKGSIISYITIPITMILSHFFTGEIFQSKIIIGAVLVMSGVVLNSLLHRKVKEEMQV